MGPYKKHWYALICVCIVMFSLLGYFGAEVYRSAPPIPTEVSTTSGQKLFTQDDILDGQTAWQSVGGMQLGSIWGHGAYQAPDWTADWLHRELSAWLDIAAHEHHGKPYAQLGVAEQGALRASLQAEYRGNRTNADGVLQISDRRAQAIAQTAAYYDRLFSDDPALRKS